MKWEYIIPFFIALQALLYALIRFFVERHYKHHYDKKLESHKAELQKKTVGHKIQTEKISEISTKLVDLKNTWQSLTQIFNVGKPPDEATLMQKAIASVKTLSYVYETSKYILTPDICVLFEELFDKVNKAWHNYLLSRMMSEPEMVAKSNKLFNDANRIAKDEIPRIIEQIQAKFREIHGIT